MGRYIIRRLLQAIPLLLFISLFMFTLIHLLPGGPEQVLFNPRLSAAGRAALRAHFGLDDPLPIQYIKWLGRALTGDFGQSLRYREPAMPLVLERLPLTFTLAVLGLGVALLIAVPLGIISATRGILSIGARLSVEGIGKATDPNEFNRAMIELGISAAVIVAVGITLKLLGKLADD